VVKQLSRAERQSFLEFAPHYLSHVAASGTENGTCLANNLGVFQVSVQYQSGGGSVGGGPGQHPMSQQAQQGDGWVMDLVIMENVLYGRSPSRVYDLKGSDRDRYVSPEAAVAAAGRSEGGKEGTAGPPVLLDGNLREATIAAPMLVDPTERARLLRALWADTSFLSSLEVMDYSLLIGVEKAATGTPVLVVGVIDFIRQYTWGQTGRDLGKKERHFGGIGERSDGDFAPAVTLGGSGRRSQNILRRRRTWVLRSRRQKWKMGCSPAFLYLLHR
jgi:1-phosphatidylinositol-3-phosphate 5-kinase